MLKHAPIVPYLPATDVARARKFYEEIVGLVPREEVAGGVVYECGRQSWAFLYPSGGAGTSQASQAFWEVEDAEAEVAELKAKGVVFEEYRHARREDRQQHRDGRWRQGGVVQGHRGKHPRDRADTQVGGRARELNLLETALC